MAVPAAAVYSAGVACVNPRVVMIRNSFGASSSSPFALLISARAAAPKTTKSPNIPPSFICDSRAMIDAEVFAVAKLIATLQAVLSTGN